MKGGTPCVGTVAATSMTTTASAAPIAAGCSRSTRSRSSPVSRSGSSWSPIVATTTAAVVQVITVAVAPVGELREELARDAQVGRAEDDPRQHDDVERDEPPEPARQTELAAAELVLDTSAVP